MIAKYFTSCFAALLATASVSAGQKGVALFVTSDRCLACHNQLETPSGQDVSIGANWQSSMMAHSSKDPYWQAAVRRESLDHPDAAEAIQHECAACHMPMARYTAKVQGLKGSVFAHLPIVAQPLGPQALAADGVSCAMCHQIRDEGLGTRASFTAGFVVDTNTPMGDRPAYGPYDVDAGRKRVMKSSALLAPSESKHIQTSEFCASCHTLYTHALGPNGDVVGELPEQVPYLEWKHSVYAGGRHCQSCHMPQLAEPMKISAVLGQPREAFSRHVFRGGNFLMPVIFKRYGAELGVTAGPERLDQAAEQTQENLTGRSAGVEIQRADITDGRLDIDVSITNLAGHKLPTAYPSRRVWIHLSVKDAAGRVLFESGAMNPNGSIAGNDNDLDATSFEPHYVQIDRPDQVQIYESIMADTKGAVTTGLISAVRFIKDNRILPIGFDKASAHHDIAVCGRASDDETFAGGTDEIGYRVSVGDSSGPFEVRVELWYQPIGFRWAQNLKQQPSAETDRFVKFYDSIAEQSGIIIATAGKTIDK